MSDGLIRGDISLIALFLIAREKYELGLIDKDSFIHIMNALEGYTDGYIFDQEMNTVRNSYEDPTQSIKE